MPRLTGEGKETCLETRDKMVNIKKSCLDWEWDRLISEQCQINAAKLSSFVVMIGRHFVVGRRDAFSSPKRKW